MRAPASRAADAEDAEGAVPPGSRADLDHRDVAARRAAPAKLVVDGPGRRSDAIDVAGGADRRGDDRRARAVEPLSLPGRGRRRRRWDGEFATAPPIGTDVPFSFVVIGDIAQRRRAAPPRDRADVAGGARLRARHRRHGRRGLAPGSVAAVLRRREPAAARQRLLPGARQPRSPGPRPHRRHAIARTSRCPRTAATPSATTRSRYATARFLVLDSNEYSFALTDQTAWLERELIAARQDPAIRHIFVVMHHPPFSISLHGGDARSARALDAAVREVPGHARCSRATTTSTSAPSTTAIHYFVSGGGGAPLYPRRPQSEPDRRRGGEEVRARVPLPARHGDRRIASRSPAIRADGTMIETTTWTDGPAPPAAAIHAAGSPAIARRASPGRRRAAIARRGRRPTTVGGSLRLGRPRRRSGLLLARRGRGRAHAAAREYRAPVTTAGIVIIGDEILTGKFADENAAFLIGELRALGVELRRIVVIPDELEDIAATVRRASRRAFDHVFTSGGVGPTHDDVTMAGDRAGLRRRASSREPELEARVRALLGRQARRRRTCGSPTSPRAPSWSTARTTVWPVVCLPQRLHPARRAGAVPPQVRRHPRSVPRRAGRDRARLRRRRRGRDRRRSRRRGRRVPGGEDRLVPAVLRARLPGADHVRRPHAGRRRRRTRDAGRPARRARSASARNRYRRASARARLARAAASRRSWK